MEKTLVVVTLFIFFLTGICYAGITIDISGSQCETQAGDTLRVRNVTASGYPGKYWIDFKWNAETLAFLPVNAGADTGVPGKTWSWTVTAPDSINFFGTASYQFTLTSDPTDRSFSVQYRETSKSPYLCLNNTFTQGNYQFNLETSALPLDSSHALITLQNGFSGNCGTIYVGQTMTAVIDHLPSWFDFSRSFVVHFGAGSDSMVCEPDGTAHK